MTDNVPMKQPNYGNTQYRLYYKVMYNGIENLDSVKISKPVKSKHINQYLIKIQSGEKLYEYLMTYKELFKKFVDYTPKHEQVRLTKNVIDAYYIDVSPALYGFVMQSVDKIKPQFEKRQRIRRIAYIVKNVEEIEHNNVRKYSYEYNMYYFWSGDIHLELKEATMRDRILAIGSDVSITARTDGEYIYFNDKTYTMLNNYSKRQKVLYNISTMITNEFNDFKDELEYFFKGVNNNNEEDWNEYLDLKVTSMLKYFQQGELERLQDEYKQLHNV